MSDLNPAPAALKRLRARAAAASPYDLAALALFAVLVALVLATYDYYAVSNDEQVQQAYGQLIIAYYRSGFTDQALFHFENLYLYGGLFDVLIVLVQQLVAFVDPYDMRHIVCALIGIAGIAAPTPPRGWWRGRAPAAIAAYALAVCGPWYGAMFNHTKDIPFAAAMMARPISCCAPPATCRARAGST